MNKACTDCKQNKPISDFVKNKGKRDGLANICKSCMRIRSHKKYSSDPAYRERIKNHVKRYLKDPCKKEKHRLCHLKSMEKYRKRNLKKYSLSSRSLRIRWKNGVQEKVLARANGNCESCGAELVTKYAVHHLNNKKFDNRLENLIVLCTKCHLHKYHKIYSLYGSAL